MATKTANMPADLIERIRSRSKTQARSIAGGTNNLLKCPYGFPLKPFRFVSPFNSVEVEVVAIGLESLQSMTEDDARAEGSYWSGRWTDSFSGVHARDLYGGDIDSYRAAFALRWDRTMRSNGWSEDACWNANPKVWTVKFELIA